MIKKDDVVTILNEELLFHECQGQVVEIVDDGDPDGNIGVKIGPKDEYLLGYCWNEDQKTVRFTEDELRVDQDWCIENKIIALYGRDRWHHAYSLGEPLNTEKECMHEDCPDKCKQRIMVNIWGSVYEIDVCDNHAKKWHGMCADSFPFKK